jgi:hypothetical protein
VQVLQQAVRLVLSDNADATDTGVDAVGQGEIDDAEFSAKRHGRFGAPVSEGLEAATTATGENQRHRILGQQTNKSRSSGRIQEVLPYLKYMVFELYPFERHWRLPKAAFWHILHTLLAAATHP